MSRAAFALSVESLPNSPRSTFLASLCRPRRRHGGDILAVGDVTGRIVLWHGARAAVEARAASRGAAEAAGSGADADAAAAAMHVSRATVHWHAEPVRCLSFSADGTYLLSGAITLRSRAWQFVGWRFAAAARSWLSVPAGL